MHEMMLVRLSARARAAAAALLMAGAAMAVFAAAAANSPMLVSRLGLSQDVANSIARVVAQLGHVPWWALLIIGGGIAGTLVRLVVRYGWRYAATW